MRSSDSHKRNRPSYFRRRTWKDISVLSSRQSQRRHAASSSYAVIVYGQTESVDTVKPRTGSALLAGIACRTLWMPNLTRWVNYVLIYYYYYIGCGACRPSNNSQFWLPIFDKFFQFADAIFPNQGVSTQAGANVTNEDWKRVIQVTSTPEECRNAFSSNLKISASYFSWAVANIGNMVLKWMMPPSCWRRSSKTTTISPSYALHIMSAGMPSTTVVKTPSLAKIVNTSPRTRRLLPTSRTYIAQHGLWFRIIHDTQAILVLIRIAWNKMFDVEKRMSGRVVMIIRHALQWVNPKWKMPGNASNAFKKLVWSK